MQTTKVEKLKQNKKMKLLVLHQKFILKKEQETQDMLVEKLQYLLAAALLMVQKVKQIIRKEN